jgi:hypothetical protein
MSNPIDAVTDFLGLSGPPSDVINKAAQIDGRLYAAYDAHGDLKSAAEKVKTDSLGEHSDSAQKLGQGYIYRLSADGDSTGATGGEAWQACLEARGFILQNLGWYRKYNNNTLVPENVRIFPSLADHYRKLCEGVDDGSGHASWTANAWVDQSSDKVAFANNLGFFAAVDNWAVDPTNGTGVDPNAAAPPAGKPPPQTTPPSKGSGNKPLPPARPPAPGKQPSPPPPSQASDTKKYVVVGGLALLSVGLVYFLFVRG